MQGDSLDKYLPKLSWIAYLNLPAAKIASGLLEISRPVETERIFIIILAGH